MRGILTPTTSKYAQCIHKRSQSYHGVCCCRNYVQRTFIPSFFKTFQSFIHYVSLKLKRESGFRIPFLDYRSFLIRRSTSLSHVRCLALSLLASMSLAVAVTAKAPTAIQASGFSSHALLSRSIALFMAHFLSLIIVHVDFAKRKRECFHILLLLITSSP